MKFWTVCLLLVLIVCTVSFRMPHPQVFTYPMTESQIHQLNETMEDIWNIQNGRFELDIVTTTKSSPSNGEIWIFNDGGTHKLQYRSGGTTHTLTP